MQSNPRLQSYKCQSSCPCIVVLKFLPKFLWSTGNVEYMHSSFSNRIYAHPAQKGVKLLQHPTICPFVTNTLHDLISCKPLLWACYIRGILNSSWVWKHKASKRNSRTPPSSPHVHHGHCGDLATQCAKTCPGSQVLTLQFQIWGSNEARSKASKLCVFNALPGNQHLQRSGGHPRTHSGVTSIHRHNFASFFPPRVTRAHRLESTCAHSHFPESPAHTRLESQVHTGQFCIIFSTQSHPRTTSHGIGWGGDDDILLHLHTCSKRCAMDCFGTYFTHVQTCNGNPCSKCYAMDGLRYILYTCPKSIVMNLTTCTHGAQQNTQL